MRSSCSGNYDAGRRRAGGVESTARDAGLQVVNGIVRAPDDAAEGSAGKPVPYLDGRVLRPATVSGTQTTRWFVIANDQIAKFPWKERRSWSYRLLDPEPLTMWIFAPVKVMWGTSVVLPFPDFPVR